ncbi:UvrD-helicase domain-containing protein [Halanaerobacter jeridensis]|uniref:DNA 3'-5' helicase n=1 Tax=Halanaerobacter jeridensis TaxID=706427 RepID=A0A939BMK5_9FIRM|nr:UvrD-helicase domain-containing protein [Halanaerobacter jeridensis]MBM7556790.1 ATP-dependent exoDNAse (exonuclease V) beta subunit [Halanaerobacter jeridensis]
MGEEIRGLELTTAQVQAVKTLDQNLAITAGAGSGKTRVLTERYIEILLTELEDESKSAKEVLETIVAITFTKKAASEMKERIRERLEEYLTDNFNSLSAKRKKDIINILDNLSHAKISTIHSFCKSILKDNLFEIGLTTDFEIVEGIHKDNLLRETVIAVIDEIRADESHQLYDILWDLTYRYGKKDLIVVLMELLEQRQEIARIKKELEDKSLADKFNQLLRDVPLKQLQRYAVQEEFQKKVKQLADFEVKEQSLGTSIAKKVAEIAEKIIKEISKTNSSSQDELLELHFELLDCFYDSEADEKRKSIYSDMSASDWVGGNDVKLAANQIFKDLFELLPGTGSKALMSEEESKINFSQQILKLYQPVVDKYQELKKKQGYFDFVDLEQEVIDNFNNNYQLVEELRNEIDFMLVDEFQDTNQMQWDIIRPLVTIDKDFTKLAADKLFIVGDPKQSIYGFRRADIRIFKEVMQQIEATNSEGRIELSKNFRSNQAIIDFTNHVFSDVFAVTHQEAAEYDVVKQDLSFGREVKYQDEISRHPDSHIETLLTEYNRNDEYSKGEYEAQQIAEKIEWLVKDSDKKIFKNGELQAVDYGDIAILMTARTRLKDYEQGLEKAGIDYITVAGKGYYQRQEIYDLYLALKALLNPKNDALIFGLFRSPLFGFSDEQLFRMMRQKEASLLAEIFNKQPSSKAQFEKWQQLKNEVSIDQLIETILSDCGAYASYLSGIDGKQKIANFEKLIEEAAQFSNNEGNNLHSFVGQLEELMEQEEKEGSKELETEDQEAVQLMTVYAAKGKEFPVVFLADLNNAGNPQTGNIICEEVAGQEQIGVKYYTEDFKREETSSYQMLKQERGAKEEFESKRVFYVGVTRAEEMLFLSASVHVNSDDEINWHNGLKWLMKGLRYSNQDLVEFMQGEEETRTENLAINDQQRSVAVKLTKNQTEVRELETELAFEASITDDALNILTEQESEALTIEVETPSSTAEFEPEVKQDEEVDENKENKISWQEENLATLKGTIIHHGLELLINDGTIDYSYLFRSHPAIEKYGDKKEEIKNELQKIENCPEFRDLTAGQCQTEVDFYLQIENNKFMNGSIDLLTQNQAGEWLIVDWKTNRVHSSQDIADHLHEYKSQLENYERAVQQLKDTENVQSYLYLTDAPAGQRLQQA